MLVDIMAKVGDFEADLLDVMDEKNNAVPDVTFSSKSDISSKAAVDVMSDSAKDVPELHVSGSLYVCPTCNKTYMQKRSLTRHQNIHSILKSFTCDVCEVSFARKDSCIRHMRVHQHPQHMCSECNESFSGKINFMRHMRIHQRPQHKCSECGESFSRKSKFVHHMRTHQRSQYKCSECDESFSEKKLFTRHKRVHQHPQYKCPICDSVFAQRSKLLQHSRVSHVKVASACVKTMGSTPQPQSIRAHRSKSALGIFSTHVFDALPTTQRDLIMFKEELRPHLVAKLVEELSKKRAIKWYTVLKVDLIRVSSDGVVDGISPFFRSKCAIELAEYTIEDHMDEAWAKIEKSFEEFTQGGSGWKLDVINSLELYVVKYHS